MKKQCSVLLVSLVLAVCGGSLSHAAGKDARFDFPTLDEIQSESDPQTQHREIVCNTKASPAWCADGFQAHCAHAKGGLSSNPDGTISCTTN